MNSSIQYEGLVTIKHFDKKHKLKYSRTYHNSGYANLFNFLYKIMAYGTLNDKEIPGRIMLIERNQNTITPVTTSPIIRTSIVYTKSLLRGGENCTRLTFYIPYSALSSTVTNGTQYDLHGKYLVLLPLNATAADIADEESLEAHRYAEVGTGNIYTQATGTAVSGVTYYDISAVQQTVEEGADVSNYYTRSGYEGAYIYTQASGTAVSGVTYYDISAVQQTVEEGADVSNYYTYLETGTISSGEYLSVLWELIFESN